MNTSQTPHWLLNELYLEHQAVRVVQVGVAELREDLTIQTMEFILVDV